MQQMMQQVDVLQVLFDAGVHIIKITTMMVNEGLSQPGWLAGFELTGHMEPACQHIRKSAARCHASYHDTA